MLVVPLHTVAKCTLGDMTAEGSTSSFGGSFRLETK